MGCLFSTPEEPKRSSEAKAIKSPDPIPEISREALGSPPLDKPPKEETIQNPIRSKGGETESHPKEDTVVSEDTPTTTSTAPAMPASSTEAVVTKTAPEATVAEAGTQDYPQKDIKDAQQAQPAATVMTTPVSNKSGQQQAASTPVSTGGDSPRTPITPSSTGSRRSLSRRETWDEKKINLDTWDSDKVLEWVRSGLKYPQYEDIFKNASMDGTHLKNMTDDRLQELGITKKLHRTKILTRIKQLSHGAWLPPRKSSPAVTKPGGSVGPTTPSS